MVKNREELLKLLEKHMEEFKKFGVKNLGIFGSFAKGSPGDNSDVDILVEFQPGKKTFMNFMHLAFYLEELLERKVELVTPESLSPYLKPYIMKEVIFI
ncbi:nucleotidyltransferase [bacterium]|nr:MAG: nucleotidyltransferase [bacterium]